MDITLIELNRIIPNDYNPNVVSEDILAKLRQEIGQKGLCEPILVRGRDNGYVIVDGEHRWRICRELGWEEIPCIITNFDNNEARIKTLQLNYMRGSVVPVKLAALIHSLNKEIKLEELAKRLPYEEVQLKDNLELLKLPDNFGDEIKQQAKAEENQLPGVISFVVYKDQEEIIEKALEKAKQKLPDGTKNSKAIALANLCNYFIQAQQDTNKTESMKGVE